MDDELSSSLRDQVQKYNPKNNTMRIILDLDRIQDNKEGLEISEITENGMLDIFISQNGSVDIVTTVPHDILGPQNFEHIKAPSNVDTIDEDVLEMWDNLDILAA